jgi:hypothetical protein
MQAAYACWKKGLEKARLGPRMKGPRPGLRFRKEGEHSRQAISTARVLPPAFSAENRVS